MYHNSVGTLFQYHHEYCAFPLPVGCFGNHYEDMDVQYSPGNVFREWWGEYLCCGLKTSVDRFYFSEGFRLTFNCDTVDV